MVKRTNDHDLLGNVVVVKVRDRMYTMSGGLRGMLENQNRANTVSWRWEYHVNCVNVAVEHRLSQTHMHKKASERTFPPR